MQYQIIIKDSKDSDKKFLKNFMGQNTITVIFESENKPDEDDDEDIVLQFVEDNFSQIFGNDWSDSKLGYVYSCLDYNKSKIYKGENNE